MDRLAYLNAKAREKGEDYGTFLGKVNQEARWDSVVVGKELLQKELELVHEIEDKGYKKFKNNFKGNVRSFQRIFDDDKGKRYFINAHLYIYQSKTDHELAYWLRYNQDHLSDVTQQGALASEFARIQCYLPHILDQVEAICKN